MRILKILAWTVLLGLLGTYSVSAKGAWQLVDETVASVNTEPVLYSDVKLYMLLFNNPSFKESLRRVIDIYAVAQYAESQGLTIPQQKINEIIQNFAQKQGLSVQQLYKMLENEGLGGAVFQNFIYKYNLYVAAVQFFVIKPLLADKEKLDELVAAYSPQVKPYYTLEIIKVPLSVAEKHTDLLATLDFKKISQTLGVQPIKITASLDELSQNIARVVRRLKKGQTDFVQEGKNIYLVRVLNVEYKVPKMDRQKIIAKIEEEKIKEFVKNIEDNSIIEILDESPTVSLPTKS
jgi:hypothetical protein